VTGTSRVNVNVDYSNRNNRKKQLEEKRRIGANLLGLMGIIEKCK
jgi:hypothetical protein